MNNNPRQGVRADLLAKRRSVSADAQEAAAAAVSKRIVDQLSSLGSAEHRDGADSARFAAVYSPLGGEIDPTPAADALREIGWRIALPRCGGDARMDFCAWEVGDELGAGAYGILEPSTPPVDPSFLAAVIVPGVGFDRSGNRIGHGVGFYDRFFARMAQHGYDPYRLGLAYDFQIVDLPAPEPWDVPVHCVITPSELIGA